LPSVSIPLDHVGVTVACNLQQLFDLIVVSHPLDELTPPMVDCVVGVDDQLAFYVDQQYRVLKIIRDAHHLDMRRQLLPPSIGKDTHIEALPNQVVTDARARMVRQQDSGAASLRD